MVIQSMRTVTQINKLKKEIKELSRYKKMWNTLKAESGYRKTKGYSDNMDYNIKDLMERIETRKG